MQKFPRVVLKRGTFQGDNDFYQWITTTRSPNVERRDVTISLLDERHEPIIKWTLNKAWPNKLTSPDFKSDANEVAIETLELAHSGLTIEHALTEMTMRQLHHSFHFRVKFLLAGGALEKLGIPLPFNPDGSDDVDMHFQSVSGLEMRLQTESISEGGQNLFDHKVPGKVEYPNVVLKRGYAKFSPVIHWVQISFQ